jgi:N-acetylglutamate synthase-like GNAT family acetyltransferase
VSYWMDFGVWEDRRRELVREAEIGRLSKALREERKISEMRVDERRDEGYAGPDGIKVRWGRLEDEPRIADLLELNGMPRWAAFEERYVVAEKDGEVVAALRYRMEPKRLVLGLLVVDPWADERVLAVALYGGARQLAQEICAREIRAWAAKYADYPREAGYRRRGGEWRTDAALSGEVHGGVSADGWRGSVGRISALFLPFSRAFRG